jgi:hypothetical protein
MSKRFKYDYYRIQIDTWIQTHPDDRNDDDKELDAFKESLETYINAHQKLEFSWRYGWNTHHPDGSYTSELVEYLAQNADYLKIGGYGDPVDTIQIWNPKDSMYQWQIEEAKYNIIKRDRMVFSNKFRSYLHSEGYAEMAIRGIEEEVHSDALRYLQTMSPELAIQAMMEDYWAGFSCNPIGGTIIEWKVAQRENTLMKRKLIPKQVLMGVN